MSDPTHTNRLAREKSPYLLQHRHNPVDWYPWGEEAFQKARAENKPLFLSIGYSTCHWCHVMERESFESEEVARYLNEHFVSIKVDREERPDVDHIYMTFVQATGGQGGWPLNCFLTPDLKPFYGGTYFPPAPRYGQPGFLAVLQRIQGLWADRREDLLASARHIHEQLARLVAPEAEPGLALNRRVLQEAGVRFKEGYDPVHGGFGGAPKFPQPGHPAFLLRYARRFDDSEALGMVLHTCERMAAGGICDQLGGGFARYSVDERWLVPHFEKMLYDNAQLAQLYLDAFLVSGNSSIAATARDILNYVLRDMTHPEGGFYSAEDADSEGKEGKFYCWTRAELARLLSPEEFNVAVQYFGVTTEGNFTDHSDPHPLPGQNVLSLAQPVLPEPDRPLLQSAKEKMFQARCGRVRPLLDDKILTSWNGLMLGAMARASLVLNDAAYLAAAEKNLAFLKAKLWDPSTRALGHRWRDGECSSVQLLEDYAFLLAGVLDLYEATLQPGHLDFAITLAQAMLRQFHDPVQGGFWQSAPGATDLILRVKEAHDGAVPCGNSVAICAFLRLAAICGEAQPPGATSSAGFADAAEKGLRLLADRLQRMPLAVPHLLQALDFSVEPPCRVVIAGPPEASGTRRLLRAAHSVYQPNKVVLGSAGPVEPFAASLPMKGNQPTAYACHGTVCQAPTCDPERLKQILCEMARPSSI